MTLEIRRNPDGTIDEIVSERCAVHIEQMDNARWFMSLDTPDGTQYRFWLGSKNGKSHVVFRHDETIPPDGS
jgi:hypothetical protein